MKITEEQFKEDAKTLTAAQMAKQYGVCLATIYASAKKLNIVLKTAKKGRKSFLIPNSINLNS